MMSKTSVLALAMAGIGVVRVSAAGGPCKEVQTAMKSSDASRIKTALEGFARWELTDQRCVIEVLAGAPYGSALRQLLQGRTDIASSPDLLFLAIAKRDIALMGVLLDNGAPVNYERKQTIWMGAYPADLDIYSPAYRGLLSPSTRLDRTIETPLSAAIRDRNTEMVRLLLQRGADKTVKVWDGSNSITSAPCCEGWSTMLELARRSGDRALLDLLK